MDPGFLYKIVIRIQFRSESGLNSDIENTKYYKIKLFLIFHINKG